MKRPTDIRHYILDDEGRPVIVRDLMTWARWLENADRRIVRQDTVGGHFISTVFLGLDHRFHGDGPPILWETLVGVFSQMQWTDGRWVEGLSDEEMYRHTSQAAALEKHLECVARYEKMAAEGADLLTKALTAPSEGEPDDRS